MSRNAIKLFKGWVQHSRIQPKQHRFRYRYFQIWLDVKKTDELNKLSRWWSTHKFNLIHFNRQNYLPGSGSIYDEVRKIIKNQTNETFQGDVYLLGSLSYWGHCYNPVCFYFCYTKNQELKYVLSEIHNTPWGQRFVYVHNIDLLKQPYQDLKISSHTNDLLSDNVRFNFDKKFHVSPFMPMDIQYDWQFKVGSQRIAISMNLLQKNKSIFNAKMILTDVALDSNTARSLAFSYPFACMKVLIAIYWQALILWLKRIPFFTHPDKQ